MTRIDDVAKIVAPYLDDRHGEPEAKALHIARALDADGHLLPDLPPSEYEHMTAWVRDGVLIEPVASAGSVHLDWDEEEYPGGPIEPRSLLLTPDQVQEIIAAHYHRKDQE